MTSVRSRTCLTGAALAVAAGALVDHGSVFGADFLTTAVLGLAAGAALGLVQHRTAPERAVAFVLGLLAAWVGYGLRAGVLPDIPMGRAIAVVVVVSLVTTVATATADRLPLWSGLVGAAAMVGAYETVYTATPAAFASESLAAATSVLLAAAVGFLVTTTVPALVAGPAGSDRGRPRATEPVDEQAGAGAPATVSLDTLLALPAPRRTPTDVPAPSTESER